MSPDPRLPPWNGLGAFDAAGRLLSFRAAADELGVTQGGVAQQVRGLEDHLGPRLFVREPRGLSLTAEGRSYHPSVAAGLREATTALRPAPGRLEGRRDSSWFARKPLAAAMTFCRLLRVELQKHAASSGRSIFLDKESLQQAG